MMEVMGIHEEFHDQNYYTVIAVYTAIAVFSFLGGKKVRR
jgi:hypothetical protein